MKKRKTQKPKPMKAWAIVDAENKPVGVWTRLSPTQEVCVMAVFRYRNLAREKLKNAIDGAGYKIRRGTFTVEDYRQ